jgi:hypothetical protein
MMILALAEDSETGLSNFYQEEQYKIHSAYLARSRDQVV